MVVLMKEDRVEKLKDLKGFISSNDYLPKEY